jgi:hypothetical protein
LDPLILSGTIFIWRVRKELRWDITNTKFSTKMDITTS